MPDDITALFPLIAESPESIMARMQADLNAGIDPDDPLYADIQPGSMWDDMARSDALEIDRVYDRLLTEVPAAAVPAGATGEWLDEWAAVVGLDRKPAVFASGTIRITGDDGTLVGTGTQSSTESPTPDADPITFQTTTSGTITGGAIDMPVTALDAGSQGNVPANAVTILDTPIDGATVTNLTAITGGADVETDEALQGRVLKRLRGTNRAGNIDYYENLALAYPGVGYVTVQPNVPTVGHVTVMVSDINRDPAPDAIVDGLQEQLDPSGTPAQGAGLAAPGATVHVTKPSALLVDVVATVVCESGFSVDGAAGTQSVVPDVTTLVTRYFQTLAVGDDVIHNKVLAAIIDVDGIADVSALTLNGSSGNVSIDATHVAELDLPVTLS